MKWETSKILTDCGETVTAINPVIISASRATDIPAFYSDWLINRLRAGYCVWKNPFNGKKQYIAFDKTRAIVFWTKNPQNIFKHLSYLNLRKTAYYFQFTLNDYEAAGLEPGLPPIQQRLDTFKRLSSEIGSRRVVWRFDPLLITDRTPVEYLLEKIIRIGREIHEFTERLVISFADIKAYPTVKASLQRATPSAREFTEAEMKLFARALTDHTSKWGLDVRTCAENTDISAYCRSRRESF